MAISKKFVAIGLTIFGFLLIGFWVIEATVHTLSLFGVDQHIPQPGTGHFGNWLIIVFYAGMIGLFVLAFSFPRQRQSWRSLGLLQGFIVALYFEMFGFPLTVYVLSSLLGRRLAPSHETGHVFAKLLEPWIPFQIASQLLMLVSAALMVAAFTVILLAWRRIYFADGRLVTEGPYHYMRHPQYTGFLLITIALLIHWPTIITLAMWPVLVYTYVRLARREEEDLRQQFGSSLDEYIERTPRFWPRLFRISSDNRET